jgi:uncharacterized membrane protein
MKRSLPGGLIVWLGPLAFLGFTALVLNRNWQRLPDRFPVHWGIQGPDRWVATTPANVYGMLAAGAAICLLMIVTAIMASRARVSASAKPAVFVLLGAAYVVAFAFGLMPLSILYPINVGATLFAVSALLIIGTVVLAIRAARMPSDETAPPSSPDHWHWGIFYYNPADPEVIVERRLGYGYTFNMARPAAWLLTAGFLLIPLLFAVLLR